MKKLQLNKINNPTKLKISIVLLFVFSCLHGFSQGDLMIFPMRAVFEGKQNILELNLSNSGVDTARYVLSMMEIKMKEDGSFETITQPEPGQYFASQYVRIFPRSVTLAPKESQTVKLQVNKASQLQPGEYRSHLYFRAVPKTTALGETSAKVDSSGISVKLTPIYGITIPVIVRVGENNTKTILSDASFKLQDTLPVLSFQFKREGNMSTYGNLKIDYISEKGKVTTVKEVKGIAIYSPTPSRSIKLALNNLPEVDYKKGKLHISYEAATSGKKPIVIAESDLAL